MQCSPELRVITTSTPLTAEVRLPKPKELAGQTELAVETLIYAI